MSRVVAIAGRELYSFFVSPVAYVVLTVWSILAGSFFLSSLQGFAGELDEARRLQSAAHLAQLNLNDGLILPFLGAMWIVMLFLLPAMTMGLFSSEKANGTEELLLTSPLSAWDMVLGKFTAGAVFAALMIAIAAFFPALLFVFGDPEVGKTGAGLLALLLAALVYVSVGTFVSSLTRSQLIAFTVTLVILLVLGMLLPFIVDASSGGAISPFAAALGWGATGRHVERMLAGLVSTADVAYFVLVAAAFLLLTKTAVDSVRWR